MLAPVLYLKGASFKGQFLLDGLAIEQELWLKTFIANSTLHQIVYCF